MKTQVVDSSSFKAMYSANRFQPNEKQNKVISALKQELKAKYEENQSLYEKLQSENKDVFFDNGVNADEVSVYVGSKNPKNIFQKDNTFFIGSFNQENAKHVNANYAAQKHEKKLYTGLFYLIGAAIASIAFNGLISKCTHQISKPTEKVATIPAVKDSLKTEKIAQFIRNV